MKMDLHIYLIFIWPFFFDLVFANDEIHYQDVVNNFIQKIYNSDFYFSEQKKLSVELSKAFGSSYGSKLNTISAWNFMQSGIAEVTDKKDEALEKCVNSTLDTITSLARGETWAFQLLDATGKLDSGVLKGNFVWLGSFSECLETKAFRTLPDNSTEHLFNGQYYLATFQSKNASKTPLTSMGITIGLCVPSTCSQENIQKIINSSISTLTNRSIIASLSPNVPKSIQLTTSAVVVIVILSILGLAVLLGTLYDIFANKPSRTKPNVVGAVEEGDHLPIEPQGVLRTDEYTPLLAERRNRLNQNDEKGFPGQNRSHSNLGLPTRMLLAFSVHTNGHKILNTQRTPGTLDCVHGIRFLSMTWVILGHACIYSIEFSKNPLDGINWIKRWTFQAICYATYSVDTFFLISGALVSFLLLKELHQKGGPRHINWPLFLFHRFWRLTPMYMLVLGIYSILFVYLGSGPQWPYQTGADPNCEKYWWTNLLYINNFRTQQCMAWSWYLANDMQFFILSPFIIVAFYYKWLAGLLLSLAFLMACFISTAVIVVENGFQTGITDVFKPGQIHWFDLLYIKPWCRIGPYIIGIITGYLLHITEKRQLKINKFLVLLAWSMAAACNLAVLYGLIEHSRGAPISTGLSAFYNACSRTVWGVGVAWVMFACSRGYGGFVNTILSWPALVPLSRLTFAAYLVHPVILTYYTLSQEQKIILNDLTYIWFFLGSLAASYMVAFVTSLAIEAPTMALEKIILKRK